MARTSTRWSETRSKRSVAPGLGGSRKLASKLSASTRGECGRGSYERLLRVIGRSLIAVLVVAMVVASGCSEDSEAEAESPPAAATTEQPPSVDIVAVRAAFKERFGTPGNETPWYHLVTGLEMGPADTTSAGT